MRQIVLDTETTGLEPAQGHRIIEIGCVELVDRRLTGNNFHQYLQPDREIDAGAIEVHGITNEALADKPRFGDVQAHFLDYIRGADLVIHNASFDIGFLNHELSLLGTGLPAIAVICSITDTLAIARKMHPGQRNSLDALCKRYNIDNSQREKHGALLDAEILADVYLAMTGGQVLLSLESETDGAAGKGGGGIRRLAKERPALRIVQADGQESELHQARLAAINEASGGNCLWMQVSTLST